MTRTTLPRGLTLALSVLLLTGCETGDPPDGAAQPATRAAATAAPDAAVASEPPEPTPSAAAYEPPQARRIDPRTAGLGDVRIRVPRGWTVDWLGIGYLHMGPGHHRYSGGSFAVVAAGMGAAGLEDLPGRALPWLRQQPGIDLRPLEPVELGGKRVPAFEVQGSGQVCGSPAGSPEAAHHSCVNLRGSVQAYLDLPRTERSLVVTVGARPLGPNPDAATVAERRQRLQELVDLLAVR
jgi:hypothetical protein